MRYYGEVHDLSTIVLISIIWAEHVSEKLRSEAVAASLFDILLTLFRGRILLWNSAWLNKVDHFSNIRLMYVQSVSCTNYVSIIKSINTQKHTQAHVYTVIYMRTPTYIFYMYACISKIYMYIYAIYLFMYMCVRVCIHTNVYNPTHMKRESTFCPFR